MTSAGEAIAVRLARTILQSWPWTRGKGPIFRSARLLIPPGRTCFEIEPGVLVEADLDDYLGRQYFLRGLDAAPAFRLCRVVARPADIVVDVGANVGYWLLGVAARLGAEGEAHAFEPSPQLFTELQNNVRLNGLARVQCHQAALTDHCGRAAFRPSPNNSALGALGVLEADSETITVTADTLDSFCERRSISRVDLLKVDVEGAEEQVFRGGTHVLCSAPGPIVLFEVGGGLAERYGSSASRVKRLLEGFGYAIYRFDEGCLRELGPHVEHVDTEDLFALKPAHFDLQPALRSLSSDR